MASQSDATVVQEFMSITGASAEVAGASLASCNNDLEQAVAAFFDSATSTDAAAMDDDVVDEDAPAAPAAVLPPPLDNSADLVKSILDGAAKPEDEPPSWSAGGRALGSAAADDEPAPAPDAAPAAAERTNPKKVRVIFWADGFTVEDVGDEEAEAAQAAAAPAAPRRTGLATLGSAAERAADRPQMPKLPPLRKYEDNVKFMEDLKKGIPPLELREIDLSTGAPRARPVVTNLHSNLGPGRVADPLIPCAPLALSRTSCSATCGPRRTRPRRRSGRKPCPRRHRRRQSCSRSVAQGRRSEARPPPPPARRARRAARARLPPLAHGSGRASMRPRRASPARHMRIRAARVPGTAEPLQILSRVPRLPHPRPPHPRLPHARPTPARAQVDLGAPTTDVQVRLAGGEVPPQRLKLNRTHSVTDLLTLLEQTLQACPDRALACVAPLHVQPHWLLAPGCIYRPKRVACAPMQAAGVAGRPYVLMDGFPPKPLAASDASLQEAGLINAAVTLRWS